MEKEIQKENSLVEEQKEGGSLALEDKFQLQTIQKLVLKHYGIQSEKITELEHGLQSKSFKIESSDKTYVFKLQRTSEVSQQHINMQMDALNYLQKTIKEFSEDKTFNKQIFPPQFPKAILTLDATFLAIDIIDGISYYVRMLSFIQGKIPKAEDYSRISRSAGRAAGWIGKIFANFEVPQRFEFQNDGGQQKYKDWLNQQQNFIKRVTKYYKSREQTTSQKLQRIIAQIHSTFKFYQTYFLPQIPSLRKGLLHDDFQTTNFVINSQGVVSVIDFGWCMSHNLMIGQIGSATNSIIVDSIDLKHQNNGQGLQEMEIMAQMVGGYNEIHPLTDAEIKCIYFMILSTFLREGQWSQAQVQRVLLMVDVGWDRFTENIKKACAKQITLIK